MKRVYAVGRVLLLLFALCLMAGCAKAPQSDIDAVKTALDAAIAAEAGVYAPEALHAAEQAKAALDAELAAQAKKFLMSRSYTSALTLAQQASKAAAAATTAATDAKAQATQEAQGQISTAEVAVAQAREMLAMAYSGKNVVLDTQGLGMDLDEAASVLAEGKQMFEQGKVLDARAKARAAISSVTEVVTQIEQAREAAQTSNRGGKRTS